MGKGGGGGIVGLFKAIFNLGKLFKGGHGAGWIFAIILIASLFRKKKKPQQVTPVKVETNYESPTYSFGGGIATSIASDNAPIPLVFGKHVVGGNIVNSFISSGELKTQTVSGVFSTTSFTEYSHATASGSAIYKLTACPATTQLAAVISVPTTLYNSAYSNKNNNANIEFSYCIGSATNFVLVQKVPLMNAMNPPASKGMIRSQANALGIVPNNSIILPVNIASGSDVYIKIQLTNITMKTSEVPLIWRTTYPLGYTVTTEINLLAIIGDYIKLSNLSYTKAVTNFTGGVANQRLYMDVVLSAGELRNLRAVYINDRLAADYKVDNKSEGTDRSTRYRFRPGLESFTDLNIEETMNFQSTVYNQNDVGVEKVVGGIIQVDMIASPGEGHEYIWLDDTSAFQIGMPISLTEARTDNPNGAVVTYVDNDKISLSVDIPVQKAGKPIFIHATATATYTDFQYTTQGEHIDGIVIGLNAVEGLYNMNVDTGAITNRDCELEIRIAPATLSSGTATSYPLTAVPTGELIVYKTVHLSGARRTKLWYDQIFREDLIANPTTLEKKFLVEIRKITDNTLSEYAKNKLQVSYVEELVDRELLYNGCSYVGMEIAANSKVNNGTPNLRFEVDGVLVPQALPAGVDINIASSTTNQIVTVFDPTYATATNYIDADSNSYALNGFFVNHGGKTYSLYDDQSIAFVTGGSYYDANTFQYFYNNYYREQHTYAPLCFGVYKAYFKCGEDWYRRFVVVTQERVPGSPLPPTSPAHYRNVIKIINDRYLQSYATIEICQAPLNTEWLAKNNTDLPSVPTDMVLYQWSDNPAWIILYLLCDENNGAGIPFENIDIDSFVYAAGYYEQFIDNPITSVIGDKIKRCSVNLVIDSYQDVRSHLERILTICHGALYNSNDKIKFLVERELDDSEFIVNLDEESDLLELSVTSVPAKDMPNQLAVSYLDENDRYSKKSIIVEDSSLSKSTGYAAVQRQDIDMYGLTNESHVLMEAMRIIKAGRYVKFGIQLKTALSGLPLEVYDGFKLTAPTYGWTDKKFRCVGIKINENKECEIDAVEYYDEIYTIETNDLINYHEVLHTELPKLTEAPEAVRDLKIYEEAVRNNAGNIQVSIVGHFNPDQTVTFNADGTVASDTRSTYNKTDYVLATLYHTTVHAAGYRVIRDRVRFEGTEFRFNNLEINSYYKVVIEPCSKQNAIGPPTTSDIIQLTGKMVPPQDVTGFVIDTFGNDPDRASARWTLVSDTDVSHYLLKVGSATSSWDEAQFSKKVPASQNYCIDTDLIFDKNTGLGGEGIIGTQSGTYVFYIKAVDTSGNESVNVTDYTKVITIEPPTPINLVCTATNQNSDFPLTIDWETTATESLYYDVRIGTATMTPTSATLAATMLTETILKVTEKDKKRLGALFSYNGNIKVYVRALDQHGNYSTWASATYALQVSPPAPTNVEIIPRYDVEGRVRVNWSPANRTLYPDILYSRCYHGWGDWQTIASATQMGTLEPLVNTYDHEGETYKVMAQYEDMYGNTSDFASATHIVNVIPTHVSSTNITAIPFSSSISIKLPVNSESCFAGYDIHVSPDDGFTPSVSTRVATLYKSTQLIVKQLADGSAVEDSTVYYIKVRALSVVGNGTNDNYNTAYSEQVTTTTIDSTSPVIVITSTTPSTSPINIIASSSATVYFNISDNINIDQVDVRCYIVGTLPAPAYTTIAVDAVSATFSPIGADGDYVFQIRVYDTTRNMSSANYYFSKDTVVANAPTAVVATQLSSGGIQVEITPDSNINLKEYVVEYTLNSIDWYEIRKTVTTLFVEDIGAAGSVTFRAKATKVHSTALDSSWTESNTVSIDTVGPSIIVDSTTPNLTTSTLLTTNELIVHYLAHDTVAIKPTDGILYTLDNSAYATVDVIDLSLDGLDASGTVTFTGLSDGYHYFQLRALDNAGNSTNTNFYHFEVDTAVPADNDAPSVSVVGRTATFTVPNFTKCDKYGFTGWMIYYSTGTAYASATSYGELLTYTFTEDVQIKVKSRQVKFNGIMRSWASCSNSSADTWIDVTAPTVVIKPITSVDSLNYCKTSPINIIACATDTTSGILSLEYSVDDGAYVDCTATNGNNTSIALGASSTAKKIKFKTVDNAGNVAYAERTFCYDATAPTGFSTGNITSKLGRNIVWTMDLSGITDATAGFSGVEVRATDANWGNSTYIYRGSESVFTQYPTSGASASLFFAAFDKAGNYQTAFAATATNLAPADVGTVSGTGEINAAKFTWSAIASNTDGSLTDDIEGYEYYAAYANSAGTFTASSTVVFTAAQEVYVPIPLALLLPSGANKCKIFVRAKDVWGLTSINWVSSTEVTTRKIESVDLSNNAFQFVMKKVTEAGTATVSVSTNSSATVDPTLLLLTDGDFDNA